MFKDRENQAQLLSKKPFIFLESKSDISKDGYISWAASRLKKEGKDVHVFDVPRPYKFDFLDEYRKRLVTTGYNSNPTGGTSLFSIFQLNEDSHVITTYHFDVENLNKDFLSVILIADKTSIFVDFLEKNKKLEETFDRASSGGFGFK